MATGHFGGVFPSLPTVCRPDGELDLEGQRRVVRFCIKKGADGLACLLFAGEFYKFSDAERKKVASTVIDEAAGRVPVLVGISHSGTHPAIELGRHASEEGAEGVIVTPPYNSNFITEASRGLVSHYRNIAAAVGLPVMVQDYSSEGSVGLRPGDLERIERASRMVRYVKVEGPGHLGRIKRVIEATEGRVGVFGGMGGRFLIEEMRLGTIGTIPGAEMVDGFVKVFGAMSRGNGGAARKEFRKLLPYLDFLTRNFESFVSVEKEVLKARGVIGDAAVREPCIPMKPGRSRELMRILRALIPDDHDLISGDRTSLS